MLQTYSVRAAPSRQARFVTLGLTWILMLGFAGPRDARAQLTGTVSVMYGDPQPRSGRAPTLDLLLREENGRVTHVQATAAVIDDAGGARALNGQRVTITGSAIAVNPLLLPRISASRIQPLASARTLAMAAATAAIVPPAIPYITILCRFSDIAAAPRPPSDFTTLFTNNGYPNLEHYYRELSGNQSSFAGSLAVGWFTLPLPRSSYISGSSVNFVALSRDCTAAADPVVNFAQYYGINMQFNGDLGGFSYGGSALLNLDGMTRLWPITYMSDWAMTTSYYGVYAHEIGHTLGWPHSSGPYSATYDSNWDVMSNPYLAYYAPRGAYVPGHTIATNKRNAGWIPSSRVITVSSGSSRTFTLESHEFAAINTNPLLAIVPIPGTSAYYTVEARQRTSYDIPIPGAGLLLHKVVGGYSRVVDPDNNGNPNDAAALWTSGETFTDAGASISVAVGAATTTGWVTTVSFGATGSTLIVNGAGSGRGTVTSQLGLVPSIACSINAGATSGSCSATYATAVSVTLTAVPVTGSSFSGWSGAGCSGTGSCVVSMTQARNVTAAFAATATSVSLAMASGGGSGNGRVISTPAGIDCTVSGATATGRCTNSFTLSSTVRLDATPGAGQVFVAWGGACSGGTATIQVAMSIARSCTARFESVVTISATVFPVGAGTVSGAGSTQSGRPVNLSAAPISPNFRFSNWSENGIVVSTSPTYQFTAVVSRAFVANFVPLATLTLTATGNGIGTVSIDNGSPRSLPVALSYPIGTTVTVIPIPGPTSRFAGWGGAASGNADPLSIVMGAASEISADFALKTYPVSVALEGSGTGTVTGAGTYTHGSQVTLEAKPALYHAFVNWSENGTVISTAPTLSFGALSPRALVATFRVTECDLAISVTPVGAATTTGAGRTNCGTKVVVTATPVSGWSFARWTEGATVVSERASDSLLIATNRQLVATLRPDVPQLAQRVLAQLLGGAPLPAFERDYLDAAGNANARLDLGDLLALLDANPAVGLSSALLLRLQQGNHAPPLPSAPRRKPSSEQRN